jgi:hypothetical protein
MERHIGLDVHAASTTTAVVGSIPGWAAVFQVLRLLLWPSPPRAGDRERIRATFRAHVSERQRCYAYVAGGSGRERHAPAPTPGRCSPDQASSFRADDRAFPVARATTLGDALVIGYRA